MLRRLPRPTDPKILVGFDTNDDAGVYSVSERLALVHTVDFFTPIVDDPELYGQIAAANSLSDVYAMGGKPVSALSIVCFPGNGDPALLEDILRGGLMKMKEAGCSVIGGHSVRNEDILFGYAVTGLIDPARIWRNVGAQPGDTLLLTKPIGTGVISTAVKKGCLPNATVAGSIASMAWLNRDAAEALCELERSSNTEHGVVHAVTDVTGFGLLGHAREMALGSVAVGARQVSLEIDHALVHYLPGALEAAREGYLAGGLNNNREFLGDCVTFDASVPQEYRHLLYDPQTSGGLLVAIASDHAEKALQTLTLRGVKAGAIGRIVEKLSPLIHVC